VYHLEPETDDLVVIASSVSPDSAFDWVLVLPRGYGTCGLAVQQKAPIASSDVLADPRIVYSEGAREQLQRTDYRAVLAVPLLAMNATDVYARAEDRQRWRSTIERDGVIRDMEVELRRHDGSVISARESARAVCAASGRVLHYEGTVEDVTERKRAEIAQRQAEALRSVTELANAAAHEINNPLLVITGNLELMARRLGPDDPNRDSIQRTLEACQRISEMVQH